MGIEATAFAYFHFALYNIYIFADFCLKLIFTKITETRPLVQTELSTVSNNTWLSALTC